MDNLKIITYQLKHEPIILQNFALYRNKASGNYDIFDVEFPLSMKNDINEFCKTGISTNILDIEPFGIYDDVFHFNRIPRLDGKYYLIAKIICSKKSDCFIIIKGRFQAKYWINYNYVGVHSPSDCKIMYTLKKGENILILETQSATPNSFISCRISTYNYEKNQGLTSLTQYNLEDKSNIVKFINSDSNCINKNKFEFMAFPYDYISTDLNQDITIKLFKRNPRRVIKRLTCKFMERVTINTDKLIYDNADSFNNVFFEFTYINRCNNISKWYVNVFLYPVLNANKFIVSKTEALMNTNKCSEYDLLVLNHILNRKIYCNIDSISFFYSCTLLSKCIDNIKKGLHLDNDIYKPGVHTWYFKSQLDGTIVAVFIQIPKNYKKNISYPLFLNLTPNEFRESVHLANYINEDILIVDVSGRGMTFGSYIGEASFFEIYNKIIYMYNIDKSRIYGTGYSGMSSGIISLEMNYPDLFAGIILASGTAYKNNIKNCINCYIYFLSSKLDAQYKSSYIPLKNKLKGNPKFKSHLGTKYCHYNLPHIRFNSEVIDNLINNHKEEYPNEIFFRTEHNLHNKSYWITIHSISYGKKYALIKAKVVEDEILITSENITGVTVCIPSQINLKKLSIKINNKRILLPDDKKTEYHILRKNKNYLVSSEIIKKTEIFKGLGLLYPYTQPLSIITNINNEALLKLAKAFAKPSNNSFDPNILVQYPISDYSEDFSNKIDRCLIIIDNNYDIPILNDLRDLCKIKMNETGYEYLGTRFETQYLIMQIVDHQLSHDDIMKVLYINTNNLTLLSSHILLRRIVIPSYIYGYHAYWNNAALIFDGVNYKRIYEYGMKAENIKTKR